MEVLEVEKLNACFIWRHRAHVAVSNNTSALEVLFGKELRIDTERKGDSEGDHNYM